MFRKVLIANRGEIACRILRSLDRLGIASVAVYSDADAYAPHVLGAGEAVRLGPAPAAESYLKGDAIIQAALDCGAEAIHPGYGFLSENADFAEHCARAGLVFIGPTPEQMRLFGLKHTARAQAEAVGVPLAPGSGLVASLEQARMEAARIGYPLMIKSTAGGGGIGLQRCRHEGELAELFERAFRLAQNNFANAGLFLEKYIAAGRHIEAQIFGDGKGRVVTLGERDCSAQRRNQKVIEETPAPNFPDEVRIQLLDTARRLMASVRYQSAGTVEFIYDSATRDFYFLEVNTRLQVEHCVTEEATGVDLVEWMIRQAAGEDLDLKDRQTCGAAIEVRLYAENPRFPALGGPDHRAGLARQRPHRILGGGRHRGHALLRPTARQDRGAWRRSRSGAAETGADPGRQSGRRYHHQSRIPRRPGRQPAVSRRSGDHQGAR
jgi:urea carboxylase